MNIKNKFFIVLILSSLSLGASQKNSISIDDLNPHEQALAKEALSIIDYFSLLENAHENYYEKNKLDLQIQCKKCNNRLLRFGEFTGGLIGGALLYFLQEKDEVIRLKAILDNCLEILSEGVYDQIINYMVVIANETGQICSRCGEKSYSWSKSE